MNCVITSVTVLSGGIAAAASVAMGIAAADPDATTVGVPDPFGVTFAGAPDITYQTGNAFENIAYGHQSLNIDSSNFAPYVDQFFASNVTLDGQPLNVSTDPLAFAGLQGDVIDKAASDGYQEQQILFGAIPGTNIDRGVIDVHDFGNGYGYDYIDLVGPGTTSANSDGVDHAVGVWLITPTGTYDVSPWEDGGDYFGMAYLESQMFDLSGAAASVPDPFGVTFVGDPDVTYQTGDILGSTAYGSQMVDFDASTIGTAVQQFFTSNVTVGGQPLSMAGTPFAVDGLQAHVIDTMQYNGLFDGLSDQQILLPSIAGTNIEHGVIDLHNFGNGYGYDYIDLVESGNNTAVHDAVGAWLVTPTGTYDVWPLEGLESQLFAASDFDPGAAFPDPGLTPPFDFQS